MATPGAHWLAWLAAVAGWLLCAGFCLLLTIGLEPFPYAYDLLFSVIIFILFFNVFIYLFIVNRWGADTSRLIRSVIRVCIGEGLVMAGLYVLGKYAIGA